MTGTTTKKTLEAFQEYHLDVRKSVANAKEGCG